MDLRDTQEEAAFRKEVIEVIEKEAPRAEAGVTFEAMAAKGQSWFKKLAERGWIAPAWPKEYGGAGMSQIEQFIFNEEMAVRRAPRPAHLIIGLGMAGPTIIVHGTEEQKQRWLPGMLAGTDIWCQGYSEPEAGSDLASLRTRAVKDGDDYVLNGQKIWSTIAHVAKWMICLARTDPEAPKHKGISYFVIDMKTPGLEVRPLTNMADTHEFNEVFFDNVRVPKENIVGEENRGWYVGMTTLDFERSSVGSAIGMRQEVEQMVEYALLSQDSPVSALKQNPMLRLEMADRLIETEVGRMLSYRIASMQGRGLIPNYEASVLKVFSAELHQRIARTKTKVMGMYSQLMPGEPMAPAQGTWCHQYLRSVGYTIEAGTSEIQRNIIAQRGLGLPRD
ncbi:MAG TPA: acyl-CoA dehydrogenase family protein [Dehalococcoidia bacterium]|nr:acyl-CoA dehydrogenase family protein [Dehalococcoidia bacterium]